MNDLRDTRPHVGATVTDDRGVKGLYAMAASEAVFKLLSGNPKVELATLRFRVDAEFPPKVTVTGRVGSLVGPAGDEGELTYVETRDPRNLEVENECPSCHQAPGRPHTEYCQRACSYPLPNGQPCPERYGHATHEPGPSIAELADRTLDGAARPCSLGEDCPYTRPHYHRGDDEIVFTDTGSRLNEATGIMRPPGSLARNPDHDTACRCTGCLADPYIDPAGPTVTIQPEQNAELAGRLRDAVDRARARRTQQLEGDFGYHLREHCPDWSICTRHAHPLP